MGESTNAVPAPGPDASAQDEARLAADFLSEGRQSLDLVIGELLSGPAANLAMALAATARVLHAIKGSAGFIGLPRIAATSHAAEDLLQRATPSASGDVAVLLVALGWIRDLVAAAEADGGREPSGSDDELIALIQRADTTELAGSGPEQPGEGNGPTPEPVAPSPHELTPLAPVARAFGILPSIASGMARHLGRRIDLETSGGAVRVPPQLLTALAAPLVQLVRNAASHGIEDPAERTVRGKPPAGRIWIDARLRGADLVVEVSDDGNGLDIAAIGARALELGLVSDSELAAMTASEIARFVFHPRLSTAPVTIHAGRGIGLDIVDAAVRSLGGLVDVRTERGKGCTFTLLLPVSNSLQSAAGRRLRRGEAKMARMSG